MLTKTPFVFALLLLWGTVIVGRQVTLPRPAQRRNRGTFKLRADTPTATAVPTATSTRSLFDALAQPFIDQAQARRGERLCSDPQSALRVDAPLNANRINVLLFGYGETHEPPITEKGIIGSFTLISYDYRARHADLISLTHDIRAPEIERALAQRGQKTPAVRMDQAYTVGGFPLMREMIENATGLTIDFQIAFKDAAIRAFIDQAFGGVDVKVPVAFNVQPFYLDNVKYPSGHFDAGEQHLNGLRVIQFIKTVPQVTGAYDKSLEHNERKHLVFRTLLETAERKQNDYWFWAKWMQFITQHISVGAIAYDFDPVPLLVTNFSRQVVNIGTTLFSGEAHSAMPKIRKTLYVVDPAQGDGGVQWVNANAAANPVTRRDVRAGVYPSLDMEIPIHANPYGNLVNDYWTSVRVLVKKSLMSEGNTR